MGEKIKNVIIFIIVFPMYMAIPVLIAYIVLGDLKKLLYLTGFACTVGPLLYFIHLKIKSRDSR